MLSLPTLKHLSRRRAIRSYISEFLRVVGEAGHEMMGASLDEDDLVRALKRARASWMGIHDDGRGEPSILSDIYLAGR